MPYWHWLCKQVGDIVWNQNVCLHFWFLQLSHQNLWQPLRVHYIKLKAVNIYIIVRCISTKNNKKFLKKITSFAFTGLKTTQQINYKRPSQQQGKSAYISKNIVATMTIQLQKITDPGRRKGHPPPPPFPFSLSPGNKKEGTENCQRRRGERTKAMSVRLHTGSTPSLRTSALLVTSSLRQRRDVCGSGAVGSSHSRGFSGQG